MSQNLWFVTGCSTGFGAALARAILSSGDRVVATARDVTSLEPLRNAGAICVQLDIIASTTKLAEKVDEIESLHGPISVLINNASYTQSGAVEDLRLVTLLVVHVPTGPSEAPAFKKPKLMMSRHTSTETILEQFNTTFFGTVNVTKAFLPLFRQRRSGTIVMITSIDAHVGRGSFAPYTASKHALRGLTECLREDVKPFGIRVVEVAPGTFRTSAITHRNLKTTKSEIPEYQAATDAINEFIDAHGTEPGDPDKLAKRVIQLVKREDVFAHGEGTDFLPLGKDAWDELHESCSKKLDVLDKYKDVIRSTDFD